MSQRLPWYERYYCVMVTLLTANDCATRKWNHLPAPCPIVDSFTILLWCHKNNLIIMVIINVVHLYIQCTGDTSGGVSLPQLTINLHPSIFSYVKAYGWSKRGEEQKPSNHEWRLVAARVFSFYSTFAASIYLIYNASIPGGLVPTPPSCA